MNQPFSPHFRMKSNAQRVLLPLLGGMLVASSALASSPEPMKNPSNFGEDVAFLRKHTDAIVLRRGDAAVAVAPVYQGRVMTSTATGDSGNSYGWLNYKLIGKGVVPPEEAKGTLESKFHAFGGEERFWLGPEGGQFGIFFPRGAKFDFASWKTPPALDTEPFEMASSSDSEAVFTRKFSVTNQSGTKFDVGVSRTVRLLPPEEIAARIGTALPEGAKAVAYETVNTITNLGESAWKPESGLLSIWLLGMYKPSPATVMAIPFREGDGLGPIVNDAYFGAVPADRLKVSKGVVFFKGDGGQRGKIGIPPARSLGVAGSYSPDLQVLTLVLCDPAKGNQPYVNSMWEKQKEPYSGDAINAYNDGSPAPGEAPLGPFYELETSSPAASLAPGKSITHRQTTIHVSGPAATLDPVAVAKLGASIEQITGAFGDK
jgi:hypothetical protein